LKTKAWHDYPLGLSFAVGIPDEMYGSDISRLEGPACEKGYLPIVRTRYQYAGQTIEEEAFAPTTKELADPGAIFVKFSTDSAKPIPLRAVLHPKDPGHAQEHLWRGQGWIMAGDFKSMSTTIAADSPKVVCVFNSANALQQVFAPSVYDFQRAACEKTWNDILSHCMTLEVPEERVNNAWKATIIANLMMATGDQMSYSAGNVYQRLYEAESGDALRSLLVYGLTDDAKQMVDPLLTYVQKGLGFHDAAFKLQMLAHVYWITRDAEFIKSRRQLWRPSVDHILNSREKGTGLLPKENYCGDIHTQVYSLNSNANCWRGLRDIAAVLRDIGETSEADQIGATAREFREKIQAALVKTIDPNTKPMFIPIALFGDEKPYEKLTDSKMGSYWDLMIPYVLGSEILTDEQTQGALDYLHTRGGICMGMIRFHQHSGLFANENGLDDLYTLRYTQTLLDRDEVDRALVSFYGKLAQGFTRDTFIGGEGSSLIGLDSNGRPMYLPPNASGNGFFLDLLRNLLLQDHDADKDGTPDTLRLLFATPRAWLADGKTIRVERAPTAFGPVSVIAKSDLSHGKVTVQITPPPREMKAMKLRVRLPDGWKVKSASVAGNDLKVENATVDLPTRNKPFTVEFLLTR
ncbi:MAG TPA: hypothetical protein VL282_10375, partial [Tepidisphaeraceae bacterium]|nr:hypothetical protein [Tepidisphaeraceae bacterium]